MRLMAIFSILFLLAAAVNAKEETGEPRAQGTIYATLEIADDLKAEFVHGPESELPEDIITKLSPLFVAKAREAHTKAPAEDGIYRVAIDWKIVTVGGQEQMKFEYRNAEPFPVQRVIPEYPRLNMPTPVEVVYRIALASDGSVTDVRRDEESAANADFYHAGREALKQWKFTPRYEEGIATAWEVQLPLVFQLPCESSCESQERDVRVTFFLSTEGEIEDMNISGEIPECIDEAEFRRRVVADIGASNVARQIRAGEATFRRGVLSYQLEDCEGASP